MDEVQVRFEDLEGGFLWGYPLARGDLLVEFIKQQIAIGPVATVLDIGCGRGICRLRERQDRLASLINEYFGVEPDKEVSVNPCFKKVWRSTLEEAPIEDGSMDLAYCAMVIEHVSDPVNFMRKVFTILRPKGKFLFLTISGASYLGRITRFTELTGIQERLLSWLKGEEVKTKYHYPALYRFNSETTIRKISEVVGFRAPRFVYTDNQDALTYWPRCMRWVGSMFDWKHRMFQQARKLNNMFVLIEKSQ